MKKLLSLAVLLVVFCSSALLFAGCNSSNGKIEFDNSNMPFAVALFDKTKDEAEYYNHIQTELANIKFKITYTDENGTSVEKDTNAADARSDGASVTGFSLKSTGTRTAKIAYKGVTASFTYTVA